MALSTSISSAGHILLQSQLATRNLRDLSFEMSLRHLGQPILFHGGGGGGCKLSLSTRKRRPPICSCCIVAGSQLASTAFTLGTVAVLPFYTLMVVAPKAEITKKSMDSNIPFVVLGLVYAYLLYLSWTPDTIRLMFASEYWLPELPGIVKMFSSEMTLASAWIHLLVVDLFAARCIYQDGLENEVETRHSVSLCLLVCPVGIFTHTLTKALTRARVGSKHK